MKQDDIRAASDEELSRLKAAIEQEQEQRAETRKRDAIAKIREMAGAVGITVHIDGQRGRPTKAKTASDHRRLTQEPPPSPQVAVKKENGNGR